VPVEDMTEPDPVVEQRRDGGESDRNRPKDPDYPDDVAVTPNPRSIWPAIYPRLLELVQEHNSTIVFVNARRAAERIAKRLNEMANELPEQEAPEGRQPATEHDGSDGAVAKNEGDEGFIEIARAHH